MSISPKKRSWVLSIFYLPSHLIVVAFALASFVFASPAVAADDDLLDAIAEHINLNTEFNIAQDYDDGEKWIAYFYVHNPYNPAQGINVSIDLADLTDVTEEGQRGWVTLWVDGMVGLDIDDDGWLVGFGATKRAYPPNIPDNHEDYLAEK